MEEPKTEFKTELDIKQENLGNYDEDIKKYTKIDNLDEDPVVESGKYFLVSFVSPEGVMNCKMRGLKIRTYKNRITYATLEEAKVAADEINKKDKYFHVFVGETGKWMGWDPEPSDRNFVEEEKWADKDQDLLMQNMREREHKNLNELNALVGKKKALQDKDTKTHKKRVAQALKDAATGKNQTPTPNTENTENSNPVEVVDEETAKAEMANQNKKNSHNPAFIKERLRKKLQEKKQKEEELKIQNNLSSYTQNNTLSTDSSQLDENMKKLTELLEKSKQSKQSN
jgi:hypothetical protein